ncbi:MAG: protein phosphatase 2C domain-containing protein [Thermoguttaceae bacterium]|nr:protein phosphatase 2C domain-containing protein [Thermoguttaceae bacterium]
MKEQERGILCTRCGCKNEPAARFCVDCGMELCFADGTTIAAPAPQKRHVVLAQSLSSRDLDRLWNVFEIAQQSGYFLGTVLWPDEDEDRGSLAQELPEGTVLLSEVRDSCQLGEPTPGWLDVVTELGSAIDELHRLGCRLNSFGFNSILVQEATLGFSGLCLPISLSFLDTPRSEMSPLGIDCRFASPEVQGYVDYPVGCASDVYNLAVLTYYLMSGAVPQDLVKCEFRLALEKTDLGPAVQTCLEEALAIDPAFRPSSAREFVKRLRAALATDACRQGLVIEGALQTDIGIGGRENNEDACGLWICSKTDGHGLSSLGVVAVADGMGGSAFGERASSFCIEHVLESAKDNLRILGGALAFPDNWRTACQEWLLRLNQEITDLGRNLGVPHDFGSTFTAVLFLGRRAFLLHVGDSRLYIVRNSTISQVTCSQTYAEQLFEEGQLTREEADASMYRHVLTSFLGTSKCRPQVEELQLQSGDVLVLCTDGLMEGLSPEDVREIACRFPPPLAVAEMIRQCKDRLQNAISQQQDSSGPESDNITVSVIRVWCPGPSNGLAEKVGRESAASEQAEPDNSDRFGSEVAEGGSHARSTDDYGSPHPS